MTTTNSVNELLARMGGKVLVIDPVTDADETARNIEVLRFGVEVGDEITAGDGEDQDTGRVESISGQFAFVAWQSGVKTNFPIAETITDPGLIRALYDHPSAQSYGDGSYTVTTGPTYEDILHGTRSEQIDDAAEFRATFPNGDTDGECVVRISVYGAEVDGIEGFILVCRDGGNGTEQDAAGDTVYATADEAVAAAQAYATEHNEVAA